MLYHYRREFHYDSAIFNRGDTVTARKIYAEYVQKMSPIPLPNFFEVSRDSGVDKLWHVPLAQQVQFSRNISMPCIIRQDKPVWNVANGALVAQQKATAWLANNILLELDYFPSKGDQVYWSGYRWSIVVVEPDPEGYWGQTNVWLGIICKMVIAPVGDVRPALNPAVPTELENNPAEKKKQKKVIIGPERII